MADPSIDALISTAREYADEAVSGALKWILELAALDDMVGELAFVDAIPTWDYTEIGSEAFKALDNLNTYKPDRPDNFGDVSLERIPDYDKVDLSDLDRVLDRIYAMINAIPTFSKEAPSLIYPSRPSTSLPDKPTAPGIQEAFIPNKPTYPSTPEAPELSNIVIPEAPPITIPTFSVSEPVDDLVAPTQQFEFNESGYSSELLDEVVAKLLSDLQNGGYGIEPDDEQRLWERTRDRELINSKTDINEAKRQFAVYNMPIPPGALGAAIRKAIANARDKNSTVNRDISIKRADMYVENRKFTIEKSIQIEGVLINYYNAVMERSLNVAKATVQLAIDIFNAQVNRLNARLAIYDTRFKIYRTRIDGELAKIQLHRSQLEATQTQVNIDKTRIELYRSRLEAITTLVNVYKADLEASRLRTDIEKVKVELFRAQIESYVEEIKAKIAEFDMYKAAIQGEGMKAEAYASEVKAYASHVEAARAKAMALGESARAYIEKARIDLEDYKTQLERFRTDSDVQFKLQSVIAAVYSAELQEWGIQLRALMDAYRVLQQSNSDQWNADKLTMIESIDRAKTQISAIGEIARIKIGAMGGISDVLRSKVQGALTSLNTLVGEIKEISETEE